jgi:hypothetical protein
MARPGHGRRIDVGIASGCLHSATLKQPCAAFRSITALPSLERLANSTIQHTAQFSTVQYSTPRNTAHRANTARHRAVRIPIFGYLQRTHVSGLIAARRKSVTESLQPAPTAAQHGQRTTFAGALESWNREGHLESALANAPSGRGWTGAACQGLAGALSGGHARVQRTGVRDTTPQHLFS